MNTSLVDLAPFGEDESLRVVVEAPKGSTVKLAYDVALRTFSVSRGFPMGISYPYDWGFIPGTRAADGDRWMRSCCMRRHLSGRGFALQGAWHGRSARGRR